MGDLFSVGPSDPLCPHHQRHPIVLFLDNFDHVQSSWFNKSVRAKQLGLLADADDFGGLSFEENVLGTTGHTPKTKFGKNPVNYSQCRFRSGTTGFGLQRNGNSLIGKPFEKMVG